MKRRIVQKISPSQSPGFDQQFWPVLVAITVLCGIALGAVLTIFRGVWLFGSLVGLPLVSVAAIFLLYHLDNNKLRRSFQFAIILSLAMHLVVLVFAAITNIFGNGYEPPERQVAQRRVRVIEISDQRASFVWEQPNSRETPEPEVEPEKQNQPTTDVKPQPVPVEETVTQVTPTPELTRRETPKTTVPKQNRELSQLRRQLAKLQPRSSQKLMGQAVDVSAQPTPSPTEKVEVTESSSKANAVARSAPRQPEKSRPKRATEATPAANPTPEIASVAPAAARRATRGDRVEFSPPKPSSAMARVRRTTPKLPTETRSAAPSTTKVASTANPKPVAEPAKSSSQLTRRSTRAETTRPAKVSAPTANLSPSTSVASAVERRPTRTLQPSISNPTSVSVTPRRSSTEAKTASSPIAVERPARSPESRTASREIKSKTLSVSRSSEGVVGIGRAKNLDRFVGGEPSPAARASDSARRERTKSTPSTAQMLTSSTASELRRATGSLKMPKSAFKADTNAAAKLAGSESPSERSVESSAAQVTSASTSHRDETSAERGMSTVDLGPTKIVNDVQQSRRLSGGGQLEVAQLSPDSTRRSRDRSADQPSLSADTALDVAAPRNLSAAPASADRLEASTDAVVDARAGGKTTLSADRATAAETGAFANQGLNDVTNDLAEVRRRAREQTNDSAFELNDDEEENNENRRGQRANRIAQSPVTLGDPGFGIARADGQANAKSNAVGEEATESRATDLGRRSTALEPGFGAAPAVGQLAGDATTTAPTVESSAATRREGRVTGESTRPTLETNLAGIGSPRAERNTRPALDPGSMGQLDLAGGPAKTSPASDSPTLEAQSVEVARKSTESSEQVQGMELDVLAMEGPAGLADRPDDFVGVLARPASRDSEQLLPDLKSRFKNREFGGIPSMNPDAVIAKEAFRNRSPSSMAKSADPSTEVAIQLGLEFLARYQSADGSWSLTGFDREAPQHLSQLDSDTAATGLAVLAFQGAGYNHREYKYARQLEKAIDWLVENQSDDGGLYVPSDKKSNAACRLYSHGIATLALTEAYGMTQDPALEKPAQRALDYIAASQDQRKGGWRYFDQPGKRSADTSVSGWMMMAMQSGRLAGLTVNPSTFDGVEDWLDVAADPDNAALYRYNPYAVDSKGVSRIQGRRPSASMTSVGLLMRIYSGWRKDDPRLVAGADYLLKTQMPSDSTPQLRDTYYWYYATQVLKHVDGPHWEQWNNKLRPLLTRSQEKTGDLAGSWHPYRPVPDRWGAFGGRLYVTSMNLLSLEVRHRLLPLYQKQDQPQLMGIIETGQLIAMDDTLDRGDRSPRTPPPIDSASINPADADLDLSPRDLQPPPSPDDPAPTDVADVARIATMNDSVLNSSTKASAQPDLSTQPTPSVRPAPMIEGVLEPLPGDLPRANRAPTIVKTVEPEINDRMVVNRTSDSSLGESAVAGSDSPAVARLLDIKREAVEPRTNVVLDRSAPLRRDITAAALPAESDLTEMPPAKSGLVSTRDRDLAVRTRIAMKPVIAGEALPIEAVKPDLTAAKIPDPKINPPATSETPISITPDRNEGETPQFGGVKGRVILDSEPLPNARVEFIPVDPTAKRMIGLTNRLGQFSITSKNTRNGKGILAGEYRVSVTTARETDDIEVIDLLEVVPKQYNLETSLKANIVAEQTLQLDLKLQLEDQ